MIAVEVSYERCRWMGQLSAMQWKQRPMEGGQVKEEMDNKENLELNFWDSEAGSELLGLILPREFVCVSSNFLYMLIIGNRKLYSSTAYHFHWLRAYIIQGTMKRDMQACFICCCLFYFLYLCLSFSNYQILSADQDSYQFAGKEDTWREVLVDCLLITILCGRRDTTL